MFLVFKQIYTYFYTLFHTRIFKKTKNCYLNKHTKQTQTFFLIYHLNCENNTNK